MDIRLDTHEVQILMDSASPEYRLALHDQEITNPLSFGGHNRFGVCRYDGDFNNPTNEMDDVKEHRYLSDALADLAKRVKLAGC